MKVRLSTFVAAVAVVMLLAPLPASAVSFTGLVSPTIYGGLADLNGSGTVTAADSWAAFYGDTDIIGGALDCNNWNNGGNVPNAGVAGDGVIDTDPNGDEYCRLIGYDGTSDGLIIGVEQGHFSYMADHAWSVAVNIPDGFVLPAVFNAAEPNNPDVGDSDFAWEVLNGRVDANGDEAIGDGDFAENIVNGWNIVAVGDSTPPVQTAAENGLIDTTGDHAITAADDSPAGFFGHAVVDGFVQATPTSLPTITSISPTSGPVGTTVTITGTFLSGATVKLGSTTATVTSNTGTTLKFTVPTLTPGAYTVTVTTAVGSATTSFTVTTGPTTFERDISFGLRHGAGVLSANGRVVGDEPQCVANVKVKLQKKTENGWKTKASDRTTELGRYHMVVNDRPGRYRTLAPKLVLSNGDVCLKAVSVVLRDKH
jgi:hypothetical protein